MRTRPHTIALAALAIMAGSLFAAPPKKDSELTTMTTMDPAADWMRLVDTSATESKKITPDNFMLQWGMTVAGKALATGADAAAQRTTLGLGTAATQATSAFELALGNPGTNGYLLSSTTGGTRSWVVPSVSPVLASQAEAEAGTENTKTMTPLRVSEAIAALAGAGASGIPNNVAVDADGSGLTGYAAAFSADAISNGVDSFLWDGSSWSPNADDMIASQDGTQYFNNSGFNGTFTGDGSGLTGVVGSGEPDLGDPVADGYVLSSTALGVRSWVAPGGGGGGTIASQAEAEAGVENTKTMTPLRTNQAIAAYGVMTSADVGVNIQQYFASLDTFGALSNPGTNGYVLSSTTSGVYSWIAPSGGGQTYPLVADFTTGWINQGSATATDIAHRGLMLYTPLTSPSVDNVRLLLKPISGSTWTYIAKLSLNSQTGSDYRYGGVFLRESSSGKLLGHTQQASGAPTRFIRLKLNSATSFNADSTTIAMTTNVFRNVNSTPAEFMYYKVQNDGTNIIFSVSYDNVMFTQVSTFSKTDFCTPDQIGLGVQSFGTSGISMLCAEFTGP